MYRDVSIDVYLVWLECFQEKPNWCQNEQVCQGRKSVKRFEPSNGLDTSSLGAVSNSDVGGHGFPLFPVSCSFDDLDFTDFQQLAEAFHEVQPWILHY